MTNLDVGRKPKAFTVAIFDGNNGKSLDEDSQCVACGNIAKRMLRITDFSLSQPLEMRLCENCWREYIENGKLENPLEAVRTTPAVSPSFLISELSLTELPLADALERIYGVCENIRGGCIRFAHDMHLPLVGPLKIKSQPLDSTLDSLLGPIGMKWDICNGVLMIAHTEEELETLKQKELAKI